MLAARGLGKEVVAEGVETFAQAQFLRMHGRDTLQGYLHARPVPASELEKDIAAEPEKLRAQPSRNSEQSRAFSALMTDSATIHTPDTSIFLRRCGSGPAVLLLHGFPETHLMWRSVAPLLGAHFTVICPDLRGYGNSGCPASTADHAPYSKRAMARDMISVMQQLGFESFCVAGHDRGGRVAYRLALDHPQRVKRLAVLDILPTAEVWERADKRFATAFWPWSLLAQPEPLPERLITAAPEVVIDDAIEQWGSASSAFSAEVRAAYVEALRDPAHVHAICEEYRAAATLDHEHDFTDLEAMRRIECPILLLWSTTGALNVWYEDAGGPLAIWRDWGDDVRGRALEGGHFFPEEMPERTAEELRAFFAEVSGA